MKIAKISLNWILDASVNDKKITIDSFSWHFIRYSLIVLGWTVWKIGLRIQEDAANIPQWFDIFETKFWPYLPDVTAEDFYNYLLFLQCLLQLL